MITAPHALNWLDLFTVNAQGIPFYFLLACVLILLGWFLVDLVKRKLDK
jgi:hypothetical protein